MFTYTLFSLFLYLIFISVNGDKTYANNIDNFGINSSGFGTCSIGDDSCNHNEVLWSSPLSSISLQVKDAGPTLKSAGVTGHAYHLIRHPTKVIDKNARKHTNNAHKTLIRGVSGTDGYVRRGTLFTHDLLKQGIVGLDNGVVRGVGAAHGTLRQASGWLDNLLMAGSRGTHRAMKRTTMTVDRGVKQGSKLTYGTMRKGVAVVDKQLQNGVRTVDKQFAGRSMKSLWKAPRKYAAKMMPFKKKPKPAAAPAAPPADETPSDFEEEALA